VKNLRIYHSKLRPTTRNIAKSGEVLNWSGFSPFQLHLGLIVNHSQSASCHIATVSKNASGLFTKGSGNCPPSLGEICDFIELLKADFSCCINHFLYLGNAHL
jgi:hypothetical protein